jgi:hypothetical protein
MTAPFTPTHFNEELIGLADGLGLPHTEVRRFSLFPELIKAQCSILGAWGKATTDGGLLHLRALDWGTDNPFRKFPLLTVYHPLAGNGHPFAQLGWTGLLGALTGYSPFVGAGEKVWLAYNGTYVREGIPWTYLFRDMLQYDETVDQAIHRINTSHRTCSVFLGLGDHVDGNFKVVEYSHDRVEVFGDATPFPGYAPTPSQHPLFSDVVYVDKHMQPSKDPCMGSIISTFYGSIDANSIISLVSLLQTGDMHAAIFDYKRDLMYVAVASQTVASSSSTAPNPVQPAYDRQFIKFDMNALFKMV